jgi:hemolysin activation/secretion protein
VDASWGQVLSLVEGKDDVTGQLFDAGIGFQFSYQSHFHGNFQLAFPLSEKFSTDEFDVPDDSFKLVFDFQYSFR